MSQYVEFNDYTKIKKVLPTRAKGINLIMYPIALEAWRRGIELSFYTVFVNGQTRIFYSLKNGKHKYSFQLSFGGVMEKESRKIVNSKAITKEYLEDAEVPVPKGKMISMKENIQDAFAYASTIDYPVVAKPLNAKNATGVFINLQNDSELQNALVTLKDELGYTEIMVEQYVRGKDTRVYVIENKVIAAFERRPANVIGDGISTISDLIIKKNEIRQSNPHLKRFMIEVNNMLLNYISEQGLSLESIPPENVRVFLNDSTLHPDGCETVDVTHELSDTIKSIAVNAVQSIPGMKISGVDIMIDHERNEGFVLELNASPNISGHIFPMEGQSRDVPKAFIDHHFPGTKIESNNEFFTFDFDNVVKQLRDGTVAEVTVPSLPKGKTTCREFTISGNVDKLASWIHRKAMGKRLGGKFIILSNNNIKIKVAGNVKNVESFTDILMTKRNSVTEIDISKDEVWSGVYPYYFKPSTESNTNNNVQTMKLKKENEELKKELKSVTRNHQRKVKKDKETYQNLQEELKGIKNSSSWKATRPLRKIKSRVRKK